MTANAIQALGGRVREVRIDRRTDTTFYATIALDELGRAAEVDARPSDALCLALTVAPLIRADQAMVDTHLPLNRAPTTPSSCGRTRTSPAGERSSTTSCGHSTRLLNSSNGRA